MDSNKLEHEQLDDYAIFIDKGIFAGCKIPRGFRLIRVHTIFNVKVDGRHKCRVIALWTFNSYTISVCLFRSSVIAKNTDVCIDWRIRWYGTMGNRYWKHIS